MIALSTERDKGRFTGTNPLHGLGRFTKARKVEAVIEQLERLDRYEEIAVAYLQSTQDRTTYEEMIKGVDDAYNQIAANYLHVLRNYRSLPAQQVLKKVSVDDDVFKEAKMLGYRRKLSAKEREKKSQSICKAMCEGVSKVFRFIPLRVARKMRQVDELIMLPYTHNELHGGFFSFKSGLGKIFISSRLRTREQIILGTGHAMMRYIFEEGPVAYREALQKLYDKATKGSGIYNGKYGPALDYHKSRSFFTNYMGKIEYDENGVIHSEMRGAQIAQACMDLILHNQATELGKILKDKRYAETFHEAAKIFIKQSWKKKRTKSNQRVRQRSSR
ncbi:MAG: hypothetical protein AAF984_06620 [Verrucomicrobiota bacterium]